MQLQKIINTAVGALKKGAKQAAPVRISGTLFHFLKTHFSQNISELRGRLLKSFA